MNEPQNQIPKNRKISVFDQKVVEIWISIGMPRGLGTKRPTFPGDFRKVQAPQKTLETSRRLQESPGDSWCLQEILGASRRRLDFS